MEQYLPRAIEDTILKASTQFKVLFLGGPRQVGKTTMLRRLSDRMGMQYVSLDNLNERALAKRDPQLFLQRHQRPVLIDEIQYAPELFFAIKEIVDSKNSNGQFWLTGSQQFSIMKNVQETLAGRIVILDLLGISAREINKSDIKLPFSVGDAFNNNYKKPNLKSVYQQIFTGSFPVFTHTNPPDREQFYSSYLQTYIDRDIALLYGVEKTTEFHTFMRACAARTGQVLNISDLARDSDISPVTAKEWLSLLYGTGHVLRLPAFYSNFIKREIKAPKLHFLDTGLAAYLLRFPSADSLEASSLAGNFFESYVVGEIYKSFINVGKVPLMYHFRDAQKREVDLLLQDALGFELIECKRSARYMPESDFKHMKYLAGKIPVKNSVVVSLVEKPFLENKFSYIPYTYL